MSGRREQTAERKQAVRGNGTNMDVRNSGDFFMLGQPKTRLTSIFIFIYLYRHNCANSLKCG